MVPGPLNYDAGLSYFAAGAPFPTLEHQTEIIGFETDRFHKFRAAFTPGYSSAETAGPTDSQKLLMQDVRAAIAASNSLTFELGEEVLPVRNSWEFSHHSHFHDRRIEQWIWTFVYNESEVFEKPEGRSLVYSLALFARWHDYLQIQYTKGKEINPREGHQSGAALLVTALSDEYARRLEIAPELADKICNDAALLILLHDHGNNRKVLNNLTFFGSGPADADDLSDETLREKYESGDLNFFSLRRKDLVRLHRSFRRFNGGLRYGLTRELEGKYASKLNGLAADGILLHADTGRESRESLRTAAEYGIAADLIEMIYPPAFTLWRKLSQEYFSGRPLVNPDRDQVLEAFKQLTGGISYEALPVLHTDATRIMVEWNMLSELIEESPVLSSVRLRRILQSVLFKSISETKGMVAKLMAGDMIPVDEAYREINAQLELKVLDRLGFEKEEAERIRSEGRLAEILKGQRHEENVQRFTEVKSGLERERVRVRKNLDAKDRDRPGRRFYPPDSSLAVYPGREIRSYLRTVAAVEEYFRTKLNTGKDEVPDYGNTGVWTPYISYYSISSMKNMQYLGVPAGSFGRGGLQG